jgi:hypothetical protein
VSDVFLNDVPFSLGDFLTIMGEDYRSLTAEYSKMADQLNLTGKNRILIVPKSKTLDHFKHVNSCIQSILSDEDNARYLKSYLTCKSFLTSLQPALVDPVSLENMIQQQKHEGVKSNLKTFFPNHQGFTEPISYSMGSSVTGRLSVTSGPKVLTAPSDFKATLRSRFANGKILQLDLVAAEPNFALFDARKPLQEDVYSHICSDVLENAVDRSVAKLITLSSLYGQSVRNLEKNLPPRIGAAGVVRKVRSYFSYSSLLKRLSERLSDNNLRNYIGRPLHANQKRLLVSHYLQSSVAETAIMMFDSFCKKVNGVIPLFVIHDAVLLDCPQKEGEELLQQKLINIELEGNKFPAKISQTR